MTKEEVSRFVGGLVQGKWTREEIAAHYSGPERVTGNILCFPQAQENALIATERNMPEERRRRSGWEPIQPYGVAYAFKDKRSGTGKPIFGGPVDVAPRKRMTNRQKRALWMYATAGAWMAASLFCGMILWEQAVAFPMMVLAYAAGIQLMREAGRIWRCG